MKAERLFKFTYILILTAIIFLPNISKAQEDDLDQYFDDGKVVREGILLKTDLANYLNGVYAVSVEKLKRKSSIEAGVGFLGNPIIEYLRYPFWEEVLYNDREPKKVKYGFQLKLEGRRYFQDIDFFKREGYYNGISILHNSYKLDSDESLNFFEILYIGGFQAISARKFVIDVNAGAGFRRLYKGNTITSFERVFPFTYRLSLQIGYKI